MTKKIDASSELFEFVSPEFINELGNCLDTLECLQRDIDEMKLKLKDAAKKIYAKNAEHVTIEANTDERHLTISFPSDTTKIVGDVSCLPQELQVYFESSISYKARKGIDIQAVIDSLPAKQKKLLETVVKMSKNEPRITLK